MAWIDVSDRRGANVVTSEERRDADISVGRRFVCKARVAQPGTAEHIFIIASIIVCRGRPLLLFTPTFTSSYTDDRDCTVRFHVLCHARR